MQMQMPVGAYVPPVVRPVLPPGITPTIGTGIAMCTNPVTCVIGSGVVGLGLGSALCKVGVCDALSKTLVPDDDDQHTMRFQVQWDTNGSNVVFSQVAWGGPQGVTVAQAVQALWQVHADVRPRSAQKAARPAIDAQIKRARAAPPTGIGPGQSSHRERFVYLQFRDARVDVENLRGQNLRM